MEAELERVAFLLTRASTLFAEGSGDEACEQITQAADLLELLTAVAVVPEPVPLRFEPELAMVAAA